MSLHYRAKKILSESTKRFRKLNFNNKRIKFISHDAALY